MKDGPVERLERIFRELDSAAERAFSRLGLVTRAFRLGEHEFVMRFAGLPLAELMTRALNHLAIEKVTQLKPFTMDCWDLATTGLGFPLSVELNEENLKTDDEGGMQMDYQGWMRLLNVYFPDRGRAFYCVQDAAKFKVQHLGSPAHYLFNRWLGTLGWQFTHAAAVGTEKGGVLIVGHGGAGKSTLTFSTLNSPLRYLSDDYCVLAPGEPPRVLALYNSGKLGEDSFRFLPHLRSLSGNEDDLEREKAVFFLQEQFPGQQIQQLSLRAIVLPHVGSNRTFLEPVDKKEILRILVDSTFRQLSGPHVEGFMRLLRSVRELPTYRLHLEPHFAAAHRLLLGLCNGDLAPRV